MNRREFLKNIGLTSLGLTASSLFLPSLTPHAYASETGPRRLIVMLTQHGTWWEGWRIRPDGVDTNGVYDLDLNSLTEAQFSQALRPLFPYRDQITVVDGLALISAEADVTSLRHEVAQAHALTGANASMVSGVPFPGGISIDQQIAEAVARPDRFRSLELGVGPVPETLINSRGPLDPLPAERDPLRLYQRLFAGQLSGDASELLVAQPSVLDAASSRYEALASQLSGQDRLRLESHRDLVRSIERRMAGVQSLDCALPAEPAFGQDYEETFSSFIDLCAVALGCDLTRVITFTMGQLSMGQVRPGTPGDIHDEHAHNVYISEDARYTMTEYSRVHAQHFAQLIRRLASMPEGDGTMLDNTTCIWVTEIADGSHGFERWPAVIAGGPGINKGRYLYQPSDVPYQGWTWNGYLPSMARPHQTFLQSVAQTFNSSMDAMVSEVRGINNARIDLTGTVPGLLTGA